MPPSGNTIKFNADGSYETYTEFQVRGSEGMKVGSTVELEFNDASGIEWKTSGGYCTQSREIHLLQDLSCLYIVHMKSMNMAHMYSRQVLSQHSK